MGTLSTFKYVNPGAAGAFRSLHCGYLVMGVSDIVVSGAVVGACCGVVIGYCTAAGCCAG